MRQMLLVIIDASPELQHALIPLLPSLRFYSFHQRNQFDDIHQAKLVFYYFDLAQHEYYICIEKFRQLKKELHHIPLIIIGHQLSPKQIIAIFKVGAEDVLLMPFSNDDLAKVIQSYSKNKVPFWKSIFTLSFWKNLFYPQQSILYPIKKEDTPDQQIRAYSSGKIISTTTYQAAISIPSETQSTFDLSVKLFGKFEVYHKGQQLDKPSGKKANSLLSYMLFYHKKCITKEILMTQFWPDTLPRSARNCLNVAIHSIRQSWQKLNPFEDLILYKNGCYSINESFNIETDVSCFMDRWKQSKGLFQNNNLEQIAQDCYRAVEYYRGDFLEELLYEDWTQHQRDNLKETYLLLLNKLSRYYFEQGNSEETIKLCKKILEKDSCLEEVHRRLMACYEQTGQRDKAIRQFRKCRRVLQTELEVSPSTSTIELYQQLTSKEIRK